MNIQPAINGTPVTRNTLIRDGSVGFRPFAELEPDDIPGLPGIYAVVAPDGYEANFLSDSVGGHFKKRNPSIPEIALRGEWVMGADVLYIGKAGAGAGGNRGLRKRIKEFAEFGRGRPVGHWGGRLLWQLAESQALIIAWKVLPGTEVDEAEAHYHASFRAHYDRLPFANLVQARSRASI